MIFLTVGASEYQFNRLLKIMDELCDEGIINGGEIIAQIGNATYVPKNYETFSLVGGEEFQKYINDANVIITHAGTGSVVPALKKGKKIIVFPRLEEHKEHLDNHQLELSNTFANFGYVLCAKNKEEIAKCLKNINKFKPNKFVSNKEKFNDLIIECIEEM